VVAHIEINTFEPLFSVGVFRWLKRYSLWAAIKVANHSIT